MVGRLELGRRDVSAGPRVFQKWTTAAVASSISSTVRQCGSGSRLGEGRWVRPSASMRSFDPD